MSIINSTTEREELGHGRYRNTISLKPTSFHRNGTWRRIGNTLGSSGDQNFTIGTDGLLQFRVRGNLVGNSPVIHIGHGEEHIRLTPLNTNNVSGIVVGNSIIYPEAWNNSDLKLTIAGHILRKDVILRTGHPSSFSFRVDEKSGATKLVRHEPYLTKDGLVIPLTWVETTQGGKNIYTVTLPDGDWNGWILDPTYTSQPDGTSGLDTFTNINGPTVNYGTDATLYIGDAAGLSDRYRTLIKFDLSSIPSTATCTSAILSLWLFQDLSNNARDFRVFRQKRDWVETEATWNIYKTANNWQTAGGFGTDDCEQTDIGSRSMTSTEAAGEKQWTLTASSIEAMFDGTFTNNGLMLKADTEANEAYGFRSSDYGTAGERPKLVIEYTEAASVNLGSFFPLLG